MAEVCVILFKMPSIIIYELRSADINVFIQHEAKLSYSREKTADVTQNSAIFLSGWQRLTRPRARS